jgi:hypothetical protein
MDKNLTLRQASKILDINAMTLSINERGVVEPNMNLYDNLK